MQSLSIFLATFSINNYQLPLPLPGAEVSYPISTNDDFKSRPYQSEDAASNQEEK